MDKISVKAATAFAAVLMMTACSSEAPKTETKATEAAKPAVPTEPVLAKAAFYEMYYPAHSWASDLLVLSLTSNDVKGYKIEDGKAAMWTAVFVSPSRNEARTVTYSIIEHDNIPKGVNMGGAERWSGPTPKSQPFQTVDFQINSDAAYQTALPKAESALKAHKGLPVSFLLGKSAKFPTPVWYIQWGDQKLGYAVFVDATTGKVMGK